VSPDRNSPSPTDLPFIEAASGLVAFKRGPHVFFRPGILRFALMGFLALLMSQARPVAASASQEADGSADSIRTLISRQLYTDAESAARLRLRTLAPRTKGYAEVLDLLVEANWRQLTAQPADAESLAQAAVSLRSTLDGDSSRAVASALTALGRTQRNAGRYVDAKATIEWAVALRQQVDPMSLPLADDLNALASVERHIHLGERAIQHQERALAIRTKLLPPSDREIARAQANLALAYGGALQRAAARRLYEEAIRSFDAATPPDSLGLGQCLINYTSTLLDIGDAEGAYMAAVRTNQLYSRRFGPTHPVFINCEENLANAEGKLGHYDQAILHSRNAINLLDRQGRPDDDTRARLLLNFGDQFLNSGTPDSALARYREAATIYGTRLKNKSFEAEAWWREGTVYYRTGKLEAADSLISKALAQRQEVEPPNSEAIFDNEHDLAAVRLLRGDVEEAARLDLRAGQGLAEFMAINIAALTEGEALEVLKYQMHDSPIALSALPSSEKSMRVVSAWDVVTKFRALVLDELATRRQRAASSGDSTYRELFSARAEVSKELSLVASHRPSSPPLEPSTLTFSDLMQRRDEIERQLAARNAKLARLQSRYRVGIADEVSALKQGEALVGFIRFPYWDRAKVLSALARASHTGADGKAAIYGAVFQRYGAFVIRSGESLPQFVLLGDANKIDETAREWRMSLGAPAQEGNAGLKYGEALRRALWDPLAELLSKARTVLIVPEGELNMLNFATLPSGKDRFLVETGPAFQMLTAERDIVPPANPSHPGKGLVAVGGVDFDREDVEAAGSVKLADASTATLSTSRGIEECRENVPRRLESLPGTIAEAQQVVQHWTQSLPNEPATLLTGARASESAVLKAASTSRGLHLATHGFFARVCSADQSRGNSNAGESTDDPLLRSGIALAGANHRDKPAANGDDGILTAEEIATSDLSSLDWVVLSACESGVGEVAPGEGVYGLRRAFAIAGARTLVMSLWKVGDVAAQRWMRNLYEARFDEKLPVAEAVRAASLRVLQEQRVRGLSTSPSIWGAFIATGAWR